MKFLVMFESFSSNLHPLIRLSIDMTRSSILTAHALSLSVIDKRKIVFGVHVSCQLMFCISRVSWGNGSHISFVCEMISLVLGVTRTLTHVKTCICGLQKRCDSNTVYD